MKIDIKHAKTKMSSEERKRYDNAVIVIVRMMNKYSISLEINTFEK